MGIRFSADEVLKMAERTEANGAAFYRRAAELRAGTDAAVVETFKRLAEMEDDHERTFAEMRAGLPNRMREPMAADPYMEAHFYLSTMADQHGGEGHPSAAAAMTGQESLPDLLRTAIGLEEKSIAFYLGLRDMVSDRQGKDRVDAIIDEEKSHIAILAGELKNAG